MLLFINLPVIRFLCRIAARTQKPMRMCLLLQKRKITKAVAVTLTTAMLVQPLEQTTFAAEAITTTTNVITQYSVDTQLELQDGIGIIPEGADESLVKEILGKALIKNADEVDL